MAIGTTKVRIEAVRTLLFGGITAAYANVGTPITNPGTIFILQNSTDQDVMVSFAGGVDHIPLAKYTSMVLDITANRNNDAGLFIQAGTQIAIKTRGVIAPSVGSFDVSTFYAR